MTIRRRDDGPGNVVRVLLVLVCVGLAGGSFWLGVVAGRKWERRAALHAALGIDAPAASPSETGQREKASKSEREKPERETPRGRGRAPDPAIPDIQKKLTFYQTLTAPLTPGPADRVKSAAKPAVETRRASAGAATPYTIQVAAYKTRGQADAHRARIGSDAYVVEVNAETGTRYRVRVGSYGSRVDAEAAAARLRAERSINGFVTPR